MRNKSAHSDIKVIGTPIDLKQQEEIERELAVLARKDPRQFILRLAQLGQMEAAREQLDKLADAYTQPPLRDAVFLKSSPDAPEQFAIVGIGGTRMEVAIAVQPSLPLADLPGCEVWINGENQIVKFREAYIRGDAAEVVEVIDDLRIRVKGHAQDEIIVERLASLNNQTVEAGDTVRIHPSLGVAFEKLNEKDKKALEPERIPDVQYEQVGGLDQQIDEIREAIEHPFLYRRLYKQYGLSRPKGILLHGPAGCGKTMIAKAIANNLSREIRQRLALNVQALELYSANSEDESEKIAGFQDWYQKLRGADQAELPDAPHSSWSKCKAALKEYIALQQIELEKTDIVLDRLRKAAAEEGRGYFLSISGPELLNKFVGETEYSIRRIFTLARKKASFDTPVVIFFDELESMFSRRGSGISSDIESTVVPQLLSEIDGIDELSDVIIIGASNRYDLIDPAVLRPGRLDLKIFIGRPDRSSAAAILTKYLTPNLPFAPTTLEEFGGPEQAAAGLISRAVETMYSPNSYLQIYEKADQSETMNRERRMPFQKRKLVSEIISGAMLESIVTRAKRYAVKREIERPEQDRGLCWQWDVLEAIRTECEESKEQYISEIRSSRDIANTEMFAVDVNLDEAYGAALPQPTAKWFRGKTRAWATAV